MYYVFLDVDGVLNREDEWLYSYLLNKECLDNLEVALTGLPVKIILTSSWRKGFVSRHSKRNLLHIVQLEDELAKRGMSIAGIVDKNETSRPKAIEDFILAHPAPYLIIDDDPLEFMELPKELYLVNPMTGLTHKDAVNIRKRLVNLCKMR